MHKLTTHYWTAHMEELTDKNQDWLWKKLCETYSGETLEGIHTKFLEILNDVEIDEEDGLCVVGGPREFPCNADRRGSPAADLKSGDPGDGCDNPHFLLRCRRGGRIGRSSFSRSRVERT